MKKIKKRSSNNHLPSSPENYISLGNMGFVTDSVSLQVSCSMSREKLEELRRNDPKEYQTMLSKITATLRTTLDSMEFLLEITESSMPQEEHICL